MAEELKTYIGVKQLQARPMTRGEYSDYRGNEPGYLVVYPQPDGSTYESWSPKDVFEAAYLELSDPTRITEAEVDAMIGEVVSAPLDGKTTHVRVELLTGFVQHEMSSCVDPANYDHELGSRLARKRIKDRIWLMLGFVLQWARCGLRR